VSNEKKTILIVDDTPENIDILKNILQDTYKIKAAINGERALKIAVSTPKPDMILLDIMMPEMDGYEVCRRLKTDPATAGIPVIFITAMKETEDEEKGLKLGAVDFITKPISPSITLARIKTHLTLYEQNRFLETRVEEETAKRLEQQELLLRQTRLAAMGEMMSAITHQWKQPLNTISLASGTLEFMIYAEETDTDKTLEQLKLIKETVEFMSQTMYDFKNYFKPDKERRLFSIKEEVETIVRMFAGQLKKASITVEIDIADDV